MEPASNFIQVPPKTLEILITKILKFIGSFKIRSKVR
jgi:hypothetical protein